MHDIHIEVGTPLAAGIGVDDLAVNSYHHQAIRVLGGATRADDNQRGWPH
ncbi:gamma-glutamyl-gamma-aminobutyrate hydrolase family protein [Bifidobacterium pseudolongum]